MSNPHDEDMAKAVHDKRHRQAVARKDARRARTHSNLPTAAMLEKVLPPRDLAAEAALFEASAVIFDDSPQDEADV